MPPIRLRHPEHEGLQFGPDNEIKFGLRGGFPPGEVVIDTDHPLYDKLRELEPTLREITDGGQQVVFACPIHPDRTFATPLALTGHIMRGKGHEALGAEKAGKAEA